MQYHSNLMNPISITVSIYSNKAPKTLRYITLLVYAFSINHLTVIGWAPVVIASPPYVKA